ncbi:MAG: hypothetical protein V7640_2728 [Betaproteobacteria bacterium]|jgi:tripartite-type tricarboxylate transporter receptor subunit TctC
MPSLSVRSSRRTPGRAEKFEGQGAETVKITPNEFGKLIKTETVKWDKVVKEGGIKAE